MDSNQPSFTAGVPTEWTDFAWRNRTFLEGYVQLRETLDIAFLRTLTQSEPIEKFVFGYGRLCCEDFQEVILLCTNGYGIGALKLLRSLYEHAVTLYYLNEHPDELVRFYDYAYVSEHKALQPVLEIFGHAGLKKANISKDDVEDRFNGVKDFFMVTDCKKCKTKRLNHTWSKLDFVSMAKQAGSLGDLIIEAYYIPLRHAHSSFGSLSSRLASLEGGGLTFVPTAQRKEADLVLGTAHRIILKVLEVQNARFDIPHLEKKLQNCLQNFGEIWNAPKNNPD